ncbi:MAG: glucosyltransferase domain-containing protein [Butyrivibrio sp.]|nr:glucosyltransferase domain-containing protein [Butyrivibrio sp.]
MKKEIAFDKKDQFVFITTVILMIVTHGFAFTNLMYSHDSLYFYVIDGPQKVSAGRWLYPVLLQMRSIATPWTMGVLSTIFVALSAVIVSRLLEFDRVKSLCVSILFSTNIALTALFGTYIYDGDADCLALLMACLAVYAYERFPQKKNRNVAMISIIMCLALYQAYICVTIGLFIILEIKRAADAKDMKDVQETFRHGVSEIGLLFLSSIFYIITMLFFGIISGAGLTQDYNGAGNISNLSVSKVLLAIPNAYLYFAKRLIKPAAVNPPIVLLAIAALLVLIVVSLVDYIKKHRDYSGSLRIIIPGVLILPLGLNAISLVSLGTMHQLMIYAFCLIFLLPFVFVDLNNKKDSDYKKGKTINTVAVISIAIIGIYNFAYANGAYTYKKLVYDNTILHAQRIWEDVNEIDGYTEGQTPVVFVGNFAESAVSYKSPVGYKYYDLLLGGFGTSITYEESIRRYYESILGREMVIELGDKNAAYYSEAKDMSVYPAEGYCNLVGDTVVIKMSQFEQ